MTNSVARLSKRYHTTFKRSQFSVTSLNVLDASVGMMKRAPKEWQAWKQKERRWLRIFYRVIKVGWRGTASAFMRSLSLLGPETCVSPHMYASNARIWKTGLPTRVHPPQSLLDLANAQQAAAEERGGGGGGRGGGGGEGVAVEWSEWAGDV
jgi:hypothetical protein